MSAVKPLPPKPMWFDSLDVVPHHREVIITFADVFQRTQTISVPFHEIKAARDALTRVLETLPPDSDRRMRWPTVLG